MKPAPNSALDVPPELLERYRTSAPRYTSYPTALDWSNDFDPGSYPELLAGASASDAPLSLYVHIPFCDERCLFCGCNVVITRREERVERYLDRLLTEVSRIARSGIQSRGLRQVHWGGGTPTHLTLPQMERLQDAIDGVFHLEPGSEVALEVDPRVTDLEQISFLTSRGFRRISLGVQDFDTTVQQAIKRVQSEEQTRALVDGSREAGMESVNIDLIYGLPDQTRASFRRTVERTLTLRPDRVALFHYAHVPWIKKHQTALDTDAIPDTQEKTSIFLDATRAFLESGYVAIGLDHFALPGDELGRAHADGTLERNFMGYTTARGADILPLGVTSIGVIDGTFIQNETEESAYLNAIDTRGLAVKRGHVSTPEDRLRRELILDLMCRGRVHKASLEARHDISFDTHFATELQALRPLESDGLLTLEPTQLRVRPLGQLFLRNIAATFDLYLRARTASGQQGEGTFSKTL